MLIRLGLESPDEEEEDDFRWKSVHPAVPAGPLPDSLQPQVENKRLCPQVNALTTRILPPRREHPSDQRSDSQQGVQEGTDLTTAAVKGGTQSV